MERRKVVPIEFLQDLIDHEWKHAESSGGKTFMGKVVKGLTRKIMDTQNPYFMESLMVSKGFDPIALAAATELVVVDGARRKYVQLGRPLRFYGGTTSATEVGL